MEWTVVGVIVVIVGLVTAIVKPIITLVQNITKLTVIVERLDSHFIQLDGDNNDEHGEMWGKIDDHERRIFVLERGDD